MKLSGEGQAEIIKLAVMLAVGALVVYTAKSSISSFFDSAKSGVSSAIDTVAELPAKAWEATKEAASSVADAVIKNEPLTPEQKRNLPYDEESGMVWGP